MKKVLFLMLMLAAVLTASAQITLTDGGVYEQKEVVNVDGVSAKELKNVIL